MPGSSECSINVINDNDDDLLFTNMYGESLSRQGFWKIIKYYAEKAKIKAKEEALKAKEKAKEEALKAKAAEKEKAKQEALKAKEKAKEEAAKARAEERAKAKAEAKAKLEEEKAKQAEVQEETLDVNDLAMAASEVAEQNSSEE